MIKLERTVENELELLKVYNEDTGEYISVVPKFGANINQIVLKNRDILMPLLKGNNALKEFSGISIFSGAHLIPFPNRIRDGKYNFIDKDLELEKNYSAENNAAHGFIYDKPFEIFDFIQTEYSAALMMKYKYDGSIAGYPFKLDILFSYTLDKKLGFICHTKITNLSGNQAPVGAGWHPYFTFKKSVNELFLKMSVKNQVIVDSQMIPTGERKDFHSFNSISQIKNQEFDSCFEVNNNKNLIHETILKDNEQDVEIVLWQETGKNKYNYLQLYIPPARDCIAIEPMTCNINAFNNKDGLIVLNERESFNAGFGIKLQ